MHMHIVRTVHMHMKTTCVCMYACLRREEGLLGEARRQRWDARQPTEQRLHRLEHRVDT